MNYPSPCDTCDKNYGCTGCEKWEIRYRYRQKKINAYARKICEEARKLPENKFCYSHPDDVRRWLMDSPCTGCNANAFCSRPCNTYLRWYDARMQIARRRLNG